MQFLLLFVKQDYYHSCSIRGTYLLHSYHEEKATPQMVGSPPQSTTTKRPNYNEAKEALTNCKEDFFKDAVHAGNRPATIVDNRARPPRWDSDRASMVVYRLHGTGH